MNIVDRKSLDTSKSLDTPKSLDTLKSPRGAAGLRIAVLLMLCGTVGGFAAGAANAAGAPDEAPSVTVQYDPRTLDTDRGADALYRRIANAAADVCPAASPRELARYAVTERCRRQAIARAVRQIDSQRLAEVLAARATRG